MTIQTTRFGAVEVDDARVLTLPAGLLGFEGTRRYCLLEHEPGSPFRWLHAMDEPSLAFIVINPFDYFIDYDVEISDSDAQHLGLATPEDVEVLALVTFSEETITANLVGPIVMNRASRLARQIVLANPRYGTRHALVSQPAETASAFCEVA